MNVIDLLTEIRVRHYEPGDIIPAELQIGFDRLGKLDGDWLWVIEEAGEIKGALVAAPCHGLVLIYRLTILPGMPFRYFAGLLRTFLSDLRARGMSGYLAWIDPEKPKEKKIRRVMERAGAKQIGNPHLAISGPIPREGI